jgi:colanic acid biosynthesis protein WcaH
VSGRLDDDTFRCIVKNTPLVSIDLIVRDPNGKIAVVRRTGNPAKGWYFVPGGRIFKGEKLESALKRIANDELKLNINLTHTRFFGPFTHLYDENRFDEVGYGTHYVVLAYEVKAEKQTNYFDPYHDDIKWLSEDDIRASPVVHKYVKCYFNVSRFDYKDKSEEYERFVGAGIAYEAMIAHYVHYDSQFWDRTQLLLAIQGGFFAASILKGFADTLWAASLMACSSFLTLAIWNLIDRDTNNALKNVDAIDAAQKIIGDCMKCTPPRLRSEPRFGKIINGTKTIAYVIIFSLILDVAWEALNIFKRAPNVF